MYLDFEKPIEDLAIEIDKLTLLSEKNKIDVSKAKADLELQKQELTQKIYANLNGWQKVQISRHPNRPYTKDYLNLIFTDFVELHGDRNIKDDKAIIGGLATLGNESVMIIGHQKGKDTKSRQYHNFGMPNPEGYRKALRLLKLAEKFNKPVITFIDTPGAFPGIEAEDRGQSEAIARNLYEMAKLRVPIICVIIGEGASGGALGIGVGDKILMLENTWYSVISPESCSSILWRTWEFKEQAAEALKLTANDNLRLGIIDEVVPEPLGGAHNNYDEMANILKVRLLKNLSDLQKLSPQERVAMRIKKYDEIGKNI
jgi:acetyl-CoA carboxylase carboxyl transferase subunit alpha